MRVDVWEDAMDEVAAVNWGRQVVDLVALLRYVFAVVVAGRNAEIHLEEMATEQFHLEYNMKIIIYYLCIKHVRVSVKFSFGEVYYRTSKHIIVNSQLARGLNKLDFSRYYFNNSIV